MLGDHAKFIAGDAATDRPFRRLPSRIFVLVVLYSFPLTTLAIPTSVSTLLFDTASAT